jgi:hypothetical protein
MAAETHIRMASAHAIRDTANTLLRRGPQAKSFVRMTCIAPGYARHTHSVEGTRRRIESAKNYVRAFGIASECGISRGRDPTRALEFIKTSAAAAATG